MANIQQIKVGSSNFTVATPYCTCSTAAATAAKTADLTGFSLDTGTVVRVKFSEANSASTPTLNINGTGAKNIVGYGTTAPSVSWKAGSVIEFTYDGTSYVMTNFGGLSTVTRADTTMSSTADDTNDTITLTASNNQATGYVTGANKTATATAALSLTSSNNSFTATMTAGGKTVTTSSTVPVSPLDESIISGQSEVKPGTGDYDWKSTVTIPEGYHASQTLTKTFEEIFPAPETPATSEEMRSGYQAYNKSGVLMTGTMANVSPAFDGGTLSGSDISGSKTAGSVTIEESGTFFTTSTDYGRTTAKPSGTDGTNYLTIHETHSAASGTASGSTSISRASVLYNGAAKGYINKADNATALSSGSKTVNASFTVTPSVTDNFEPYYVPIVTASATAGTATATATVTKSPSASTTASTATITVTGIATTTATTSYKIEASASSGSASASSGVVTASSSATGGSASVGKGITSGATATGTSSGNKSATTTEQTASSTAKTASTVIYIPAGACTVAGGGLSQGAASGGGLSGGGLSGGDLSTSATASVTTAPAVTPKVNRTYTGVSGVTDATYGIVTSTSGLTKYIKLDPDGTATAGVAKAESSATRATVTRATVSRAKFSKAVTRADITDAHTAGYIPNKTATTVISSATSTVELAAGSMAATTLAEDTATASNTCTITPTVNGGTNYYIPIVDATATAGTATATATIAKEPTASTTASSATATVTGMVTTTTNTGYSVSASATSGSASAASGYSTASASATGGSASVGKGLTAGGTATGASSGDKSATSTEKTASSSAKTASTTTYIQKGALSAGATVTANGSASMAATGFTPSSSSTSYYVTLSTSAGSVKGTASVDTEGYVKNETATGSATSVSVSGNGDKVYIPTTSRSASTGHVTLTSGSGSVSSTATNMTITEVSSAPSSGYYITSTGSGTVSGTGYGKVSTGTGFITSGTTSSNTSSSTSKSSNTATKYYTVQAATTSNITTSTSTTAVPIISEGYIKATSISAITVPDGKSLTVSGDGYSDIYAVPNNDTTDNRVYTKAYNESDYQMVINDGTWVSHDVTPSSVAQGPFYGKTTVQAAVDPHTSYTPNTTYFKTGTSSAISAASIPASKYATSTYYVKAGALSNVTTSSTSSYVPLVSTAGWLSTNYISDLTVPSGKSLSTITNNGTISSAYNYGTLNYIYNYGTISSITQRDSGTSYHAISTINTSYYGGINTLNVNPNTVTALSTLNNSGCIGNINLSNGSSGFNPGTINSINMGSETTISNIWGTSAQSVINIAAGSSSDTNVFSGSISIGGSSFGTVATISNSGYITTLNNAAFITTLNNSLTISTLNNTYEITNYYGDGNGTLRTKAGGSTYNAGSIYNTAGTSGSNGGYIQYLENGQFATISSLTNVGTISILNNGTSSNSSSYINKINNYGYLSNIDCTVGTLGAATVKGNVGFGYFAYSASVISQSQWQISPFTTISNINSSCTYSSTYKYVVIKASASGIYYAFNGSSGGALTTTYKNLQTSLTSGSRISIEFANTSSSSITLTYGFTSSTSSTSSTYSKTFSIPAYTGGILTIYGASSSQAYGVITRKN